MHTDLRTVAFWLLNGKVWCHVEQVGMRSIQWVMVRRVSKYAGK